MASPTSTSLSRSYKQRNLYGRLQALLSKEERNKLSKSSPQIWPQLLLRRVSQLLQIHGHPSLTRYLNSNKTHFFRQQEFNSSTRMNLWKTNPRTHQCSRSSAAREIRYRQANPVRIALAAGKSKNPFKPLVILINSDSHFAIGKRRVRLNSNSRT